MVLSVLAARAWRQAAYWRDSETLWTHTVDCTSKNAIAENNLGVFLSGQGRDEEAAAHYEKSLVVAPRYVDAHDNLALSLCSLGRFDDAMAHWQRALELKPDYAKTHVAMANALMGSARTDQAIAFDHPDQAARRKRSSRGEGADAVQTKRDAEAISHYRTAIRLRPEYVPAAFSFRACVGRIGTGRRRPCGMSQGFGSRSHKIDDLRRPRPDAVRSRGV